MALDRQKILGELGSVMNQLQSADCGCLGKLFGNSQQASPTMGNPLPTCGGCRRGCCHGHGCGQYNSSAYMNQPTPNTNYMAMGSPNPPHQPMSGNMFGFGPQIVNMMRGDHVKSQNMPEQAHGQLPGQLTGPMVIDAPQSPHGKVGLMPFTPPSMVQQRQLNPDIMNQGDIGGQMQNQFTPQSNTHPGNIANMSSWPQQNVNSNTVPHQMTTPQMSPWPQQGRASTPAAHQTSTTYSNPHGQHSEGIAKFNKMFPGVKQGMGGDLGFDPMAIAIQMNPDNHLQSAMDTMNKIMNVNQGTDQTHNRPPASQPGIAGNTMNQSYTTSNGMVPQNAIPDHFNQSNINQLAEQKPNDQNVIGNQVSPNQQYTYANTNAYGHAVPQQNQQIYATAVDPNTVNQQARYDDPQQFTDQQQKMHLDVISPNLPIIQHNERVEDQQLEGPSTETTGYPSQAPAQHMIKEPIFPVDTSKNLIYMPTKQQKKNNYGYNTLGQPVEMLPAEIYHPPEPTLPQTLSPQPNPVKLKNNLQRAVNVKASVSKTSLMGNKQIGKTPSRAQLQHIYNQYKGSQSFTQQNVRSPGVGTFSSGRLNVPEAMKASPVPVERVGGDTVVNNSPNIQERINKVEQVMEQIGDVPTAKPAGDSVPLKEAAVNVRKCRNGLQDMVFSSYPTSAAWTFHGHGRHDPLSTPRFRHRHY